MQFDPWIEFLYFWSQCTAQDILYLVCYNSVWNHISCQNFPVIAQLCKYVPIIFLGRFRESLIVTSLCISMHSNISPAFTLFFLFLLLYREANYKLHMQRLRCCTTKQEILHNPSSLPLLKYNALLLGVITCMIWVGKWQMAWWHNKQQDQEKSIREFSAVIDLLWFSFLSFFFFASPSGGWIT